LPSIGKSGTIDEVLRRRPKEPAVSWEDVNAIIRKLMEIDVKLNRVLWLLEAENGEEEA